MLIRKAKKNDLKQIAELDIALAMEISRKDFFKKDEKIVKKNARPIILKNFNNPKKIILVAEEKDQAAGYVVGTIKTQNPIFRIKKIGFVNDVFVQKKFRKQSLGKRLVEEIIRYFKNKKIDVIQLSVLSNNIPALKLYQKLGFKENRKKMVKKI